MRLIEGYKALIDLLKDYRTMDKEDRDDFYLSKCEYYQRFVSMSLLAGALISVGYLLLDFLVNGSILDTLLPRMSALVALLIFLAVTHAASNRNLIIFMDYLFCHALVLSVIWTFAHLQDKHFAGEGFVIMNLVFITVGFASRPRETAISSIIFILEILISNIFIHYERADIIVTTEIICGFGVLCTHIVQMLFYLDHYRTRQQLELAMITDPLTQVYNRHLLEKIVKQNALQDMNGPAAFAMLDIDHFKKINDDNGHYTGDLTLLYIGQKLARETHDNDYVIRYGGEEFVIIFKNCDVNNACARMEQFRRDIESATDTPVPFTISVGVSRYTGDYSKSIQNVDTALYKAKNSGRNKVVVL